MSARSGMRAPPWTLDDTGLQYFECSQCGSVSIQKFDVVTGYGQIWGLAPEARVLFRHTDTPAVVLKYVLSDDFYTNFSICEQLFAGSIRELDDLSYPVNAVLADMKQHEDPLQLTQMIALLHVVFLEVLERRGQGRDVRCSIGSLDVVETLAKGIFRAATTDPAVAADLRSAALNVFEVLSVPDMRESVREGQIQTIEDMVDHAKLLIRSQADVQEARQRVHSDGMLTLETEARFLLDVFKRRDARLTEKHASLFWGCLRDLHARLGTTNSGKGSVRSAYATIQTLLEHQLISLGLESTPGGFVDPSIGCILKIRELQPVVVVYRLSDSTNPLKVFDAWHDVYGFIVDSQRASDP